jgi:mannose-6-phosphate isomerase-like protein (cupin superfamily)
MNKKSGYVVLLATLCLTLLNTGCETTGSTRSASSHRVRVITPNQVYTDNRWTNAERMQDVATRSIRVTRNASYHMICLNKAEKPHVHDQHDMVVTVLSGTGRLHLNLKTYDLTAGDVIEIPRGTLHWTENTGSKEPCEAFAVFTPPYQGRDIRLVNVPGQ